MNRERAETYLRLLAEAELHRARRLLADSPQGVAGGRCRHGTRLAAEQGFRPWPVLWIRGSGGGWHTTRLAGMNSKEGGAVMLRLATVPPLARGDTGIEVIATGQSAEVRVCLPLRWI